MIWKPLLRKSAGSTVQYLDSNPVVGMSGAAEKLNKGPAKSTLRPTSPERGLVRRKPILVERQIDNHEQCLQGLRQRADRTLEGDAARMAHLGPSIGNSLDFADSPQSGAQIPIRADEVHGGRGVLIEQDIEHEQLQQGLEGALPPRALLDKNGLPPKARPVAVRKGVSKAPPQEPRFPKS